MRIAWLRATADTSDEPSAPAAAEADLAAIELLLDDGRHTGWIATGGLRTSDWLNAHAEIPIHALAGPDPAPPSAVDHASPLDRDRIVWVVPPPLPPNRHLRLHRRRVLVHLELDDHEVSGQAHVRPGADATDQMLRGSREMIPLTDVQVVARDDAREGVAHPVLIVNRRHVRRVVVDAPHQSAPVAEPVDETSPPTLEALGVPVPEPPTPEPARIESGSDLVLAALTVLLETGVIDLVEFQSIRARIPAAGDEAAPA